MNQKVWLRVLITGIALISILYAVRSTIPYIGATHSDDAFMFIRYAEHWTSGNGFVWNVGDGPAYGLTSPLYLFLLTALWSIAKIPDAVLLTEFSVTAGLLSCLALVALGFQFNRNPAIRKFWLPLLVIPCLVFSPLFIFHSSTGMETQLALLTTALFALSLTLTSRKPSPLTLTICLSAAYTTYLARPENGVFALLLPPLFLIATSRTLWKYALAYTITFCVVLVLDALLKISLFGDFLPLPFFAKAAGFYRGYLGILTWNNMTEMLTFGQLVLPYLLTLVACATRPDLPRLAAIALPLAIVFFYLATVTQITGAHARYYYPFLPFFIMAAFLVLDSYAIPTLEQIPRPQGFPIYRLLIALFILLPIVSPDLLAAEWSKYIIGAPVVYLPKTQYTIAAPQPLLRLEGQEINPVMSNLLARLPQTIVLSASEYGLIGARHPDMVILDSVGLQDSHVAHNGFSADYMLSRQPDLIWLPHSDYTYNISEIIDNKSFFSDYDFYPKAYAYGIALRRASPYFSTMQKIISEDFARLYPGSKLSDYRAIPLVTSP